MTFLRYLRTVLWSFFGIRKGQGARSDARSLAPIPLAVTAIALAAVFVLTLLALARVAVSSLGA